MPVSRPQSRSTDWAPRGAGQLDERVRVQRMKTEVQAHRVLPQYEDIVPGGSPQNIQDSARFASVIPRSIGAADPDQEVVQMAGDVTRREYAVRLRHIPEITTKHRLVWRGVFLYVQSTDHETERRAGGGYSTLVCVHSADQPSEELAGGGVAGGPTPNSSGEFTTEPIQ